MGSDMERPAIDGGPDHQSGQRSDVADCSDPVVCRIDPTRDCHRIDVVHRLGADYCRLCADDFVLQLRRRVARHYAGIDPDSMVGIGNPVHPAESWGPPWYVLQCDICPRVWVGRPHEVCDTCAKWWHDAEQHHRKQSERRTRGNDDRA